MEDPGIKKIDLPKLNTNKTLYLVVTEGPIYYCCSRLDQLSQTVEINGFEVAKGKGGDENKVIVNLKNTQSYTEALESVKKVSTEQHNLIIPWHKIIKIRKFNYSNK